MFYPLIVRDTKYIARMRLSNPLLLAALLVAGLLRGSTTARAEQATGPLSPAILTTPQDPTPKQLTPLDERSRGDKTDAALDARPAKSDAPPSLIEGVSSGKGRPAEDTAEKLEEAKEGGSLPSEGNLPGGSKNINVLELAIQGGIFMIPIAALSLLAATMMVERLIGLRRQRVLPDALLDGLDALGSAAGGFDPRKAYRLCQQYPSAAANVVRALLLKVGRPLAEVEHTVAEASEREADRLYRNVRWLNLAAALAPLLGLLGTVQGMIIAFHHTTILEPGQNKSIILAEGIYTALVTTFAGLVVAIPSALFSHYFEGRIQGLFHEIDELVFNLLPQIERYEGRMRFARQVDASESMLAEQRAAPSAEARPASAEPPVAPEVRPARAAAGSK